MILNFVPSSSFISIGAMEVVERREEAPRVISLALRSSTVFTPAVCQATSTRPKSLMRPRKRNFAGSNFTACGSVQGVTKKFGMAMAMAVPIRVSGTCMMNQP